MIENENELTQEELELEKRHRELGWTTLELARAVDVDSSRIRQLLGEGKIEGKKLGHVWAIPHSEAVKFIEWYRKEKGY